MDHCTTNLPQLKEIETELFRCLQVTFKETLAKILEKIDEDIATQRDKKRFELKDKREVRLKSAFGPIVFKRNYYRDREEKRYVCLLDRHLQLEGSKGFSPLLEEWALQLAAEGPSYRHAAEQLKHFLGYPIMSHESLRQHLLETEVGAAEEKRVAPEVLFVEVDGLYVKQQRRKKRGHELKIAAVHEGWEKNGQRVQLKHKRHYLHRGKGSFWEGFETFLEANYDYDATQTKLVIGGDGAPWITACREYFRANSFFVLDRFHVARELRDLFRDHPRYRAIRVALKKYDAERLLAELNSAVGTMATDEQKEGLEQLLQFLEGHQEALKDYRGWLQAQGVDTRGLYPMGSAEAMMRVFAKRLKGGRSWSEKGVYALTQLWIGVKDSLPIQMLCGNWETKEEREGTRAEHATERKKSYSSMAVEATRNNIQYLMQSSGTAIHQALKGLKGF